MKNRFDTFIFDLDGTLLDTVPDLTLLTNRILREIGAPQHTQDEILSYVGAGVRRLILLALPPDSTDADIEHAMDLWNKYFASYHEHTVPYPEIPNVLDSLKEQGKKVGVMSNKLQEGVNDILSRKLPGYFESAIGERDDIARKPDPSGILKVMEELKTTPGKTIYVGDSPNDIIAAHRAGCSAAAALWGYHEKKDFLEAAKDTNSKSGFISETLPGYAENSKPDARPDFFLTSPSDLLYL